MTEKQNKIVKLLWDFNSLREEHVMKLCDCTEEDINFLIASKIIEKDKNTKVLKHKLRELNNRNIVSFDVVMQYLDRTPEIRKGKYPVNVTMKTKYNTYDIIAIKQEEIDNLYDSIEEKSRSDKLIIIIETKQYIKRKLQTSRPCYICIYPPLEIVDRIN